MLPFLFNIKKKTSIRGNSKMKMKNNSNNKEEAPAEFSLLLLVLLLTRRFYFCFFSMELVERRKKTPNRFKYLLRNKTENKSPVYVVYFSFCSEQKRRGISYVVFIN